MGSRGSPSSRPGQSYPVRPVTHVHSILPIKQDQNMFAIIIPPSFHTRHLSWLFWAKQLPPWDIQPCPLWKGIVQVHIPSYSLPHSPAPNHSLPICNFACSLGEGLEFIYTGQGTLEPQLHLQMWGEPHSCPGRLPRDSPLGEEGPHPIPNISVL